MHSTDWAKQSVSLSVRTPSHQESQLEDGLHKRDLPNRREIYGLVNSLDLGSHGLYFDLTVVFIIFIIKRKWETFQHKMLLTPTFIMHNTERAVKGIRLGIEELHGSEISAGGVFQPWYCVVAGRAEGLSQTSPLTSEQLCKCVVRRVRQFSKTNDLLSN